jgi:hypothetical protein
VTAKRYGFRIVAVAAGIIAALQKNGCPVAGTIHHAGVDDLID